MPRSQASEATHFKKNACHLMITVRWAKGYSTRVLTVNSGREAKTRALLSIVAYRLAGGEVMARMKSTSSWRYGVPSVRKISWNQTVGSRSV